jgi:hypothetical protein
MIGIYTEDRELKKALSDKTSTVDVHKSFPSVSGVFIDWVYTANRKSPSKSFVHQAAIVNYYTKKGIPIVLYDRFMFINEDEYKWLNKLNTFLFEPALNNRKGFEYIPHWINTSDENILDMTHERSIDIGYVGDKNIPSFEKYYLEYMKKYNRNVVCDSSVDWRSVKCTVAIDSEHVYNIGYLNSNVIDALNNGCTVLCPEEHKYYFGIFYPYVVNNIEWVEYIINACNNNDVLMASALSLFKRIRESFPEFSINYAVSKILECFK